MSTIGDTPAHDGSGNVRAQRASVKPYVATYAPARIKPHLCKERRAWYSGALARRAVADW